MKGADWTKYGSILKNMVTQYSLGNDQYPKTLEVAVDVLTEHHFDANIMNYARPTRRRNVKKLIPRKRQALHRKKRRTKRWFVIAVARQVTLLPSVIKGMRFHVRNGMSTKD
jgi:hypothetical protein